MAMDPAVKKLIGLGVGMGSLSAIVLTSLAVVNGFKDTNRIDNSTADLFIAAIAIIGSFAAVIVLAFMGKIIYKMFQDN